MFNAALDANFHLPEEARKTSETMHQTDISLSISGVGNSRPAGDFFVTRKAPLNLQFMLHDI